MRGKKVVARFLVIFLLFVMMGGALSASAGAEESGTSPNLSLIVKLVRGLSADEQAAVISANGGTEISSIPALRLHVVEIPLADLETVIQNYQADQRVVRVEENKTRKAEALPSDGLYPYQWSMPKIGWDLVFGTLTPGGSSKIAILDTGVDAHHPDLSGKVAPGTSMLDGSDGTTDPNGHGTWLAGIVAAQTGNREGIAGVGYAGVDIVPVTVLGTDGTGQDSDIIAGLIWAVDNGADVILMGFSNPGFSANLQEAIDYAWESNVVLVASTGNDATLEPTYPAGDRGVIGVSATDPLDSLASFSNSGQDVFLAAPGTDVVATDLRGYATISGTSASAAIVAGVAGFMKAVDPTLTNGIIVGRLARTADPAGTQEQTGNGRVNMARALADTGIEPIQPAGAPGGGPYVGPYVVAGSAKLDGTVIDSSTGNPINGATVSITCSECSTGDQNVTLTTDSNGNYSRNLNASGGGFNQSLSISVSKPGYSNATWKGTVTGPTTINFSLTPSCAAPSISTPPLSQTKTVGESAIFSVTASGNAPLSYQWRKGGSNISGATGSSYTISSVVVADAGSFDVVVSNSCGSVPSSAAALTVNKANATCTVSGYSVTYDGAPHTATGSCTGVGGIALSGLNLSGTMHANAGDYPSDPWTFTDATGNYNNASGTVHDHINKAMATVILTNLTQSYTGIPQTPTAATTPSGLTIVWNGAPQTNAGSYSVTATVNETNYEGSASGTFTINRATATVTLGNMTQSYTGSLLSPTAATTPPGLSIAWTNAPQTNAGSYPVTATVNETNYEGSASGTFTINKANQTITFGSLPDKTAGDAAFTVSATATSSLSVVFSSLTTSVCTVAGNAITLTNHAGPCTVRASQDGDDNYFAAPNVDQSFNVLPGPAVAFSVTAPASTIAGALFSVTVTAKDLYNNIATGYAGTVHFTSTDPSPSVVLPGNYTFVAGDNGTHLFTNEASLRRAGIWTITATDALSSLITGISGSIEVNPGAATKFSVTAPPIATAGSPFSVIVTAKDTYDNIATGYAGTVHFTTSDTGDLFVLPADYTFSAGDNGEHTFTDGATLVTAGIQTITVADTVQHSITDDSGSILVMPGPAVSLDVVASKNTVTAFEIFDVTVTALDAYGNIATGYTGTVRMTSSDTLAELPADYLFVSGDNGVHTFDSVVLETGGTQTVSAADTDHSSITGTSGNITVNKAKATITLSNLTHTYDGTQKVATATTAPAGLATVTITYDGSTTAPTNAGNYAVVATLNNPSYEADPANGTLTIDKAPSTTTVACPGNVTYTGAALEPCTASYSGAGGLSGSLTPSYTNNTNAGTAIASATYAGDANHTGSTGSMTFTIDKAPSTTTVTVSDTIYDGNPHGGTANVTGAGGLNQAVTVNYAGRNGTVYGPSTTAPTSAGDYQARATFAGDANHTGSQDSKPFTINKAGSITTVTCPASVIYNGTAQTPCAASATGAGGLSGSLTPSYTNNTNAGTAIASATYAGDANHTGSTGSMTFIITKATLTVTADGWTRQYSDPNPTKFTFVYSGFMGIDGSGVIDTPPACSTSRTVNSAPGTYPIICEGGADNNYAFSYVTGTFIVNPEDARVTYTGLMFFSTPSISSSTATILLTATVQDITATPDDPDYDANGGDIRNARVWFVNRDAGSAILGSCAGLVPALVDPSDTKTGTVSCSVTISLNSADSVDFTLGIVVKNYYTRDSSEDDTVITVSKPVAGLITGGGYIVNQASAGRYAGTQGRKSNFGFNVKNNKTGKNLQGHANIIVRRLVSGAWRTYQIKTTATDSLNYQDSTGKASFISKANLTDITDPLNPVSVGSGLQLQVAITDNGEPGSSDTIALTLWQGSTLLYSSNWNGTRTVEQALGGGNLVDH